MEYQMISLSHSTYAANVELNGYAEKGWTVHTATQYFILLERSTRPKPLNGPLDN